MFKGLFAKIWAFCSPGNSKCDSDIVFHGLRNIHFLQCAYKFVVKHPVLKKDVGFVPRTGVLYLEIFIWNTTSRPPSKHLGLRHHFLLPCFWLFLVCCWSVLLFLNSASCLSACLQTAHIQLLGISGLHHVESPCTVGLPSIHLYILYLMLSHLTLKWKEICFMSS